MNTNLNKQAIFTDKYGDEKEMYRDRHGWKIRRKDVTPIIAVNREISTYVGKKVNERRLEKGYTLQFLGVMCHMYGDPKGRIWAIENNTRSEGIRFGTLYLLAEALECEIQDLLPTKKEMAKFLKEWGMQIEKPIKSGPLNRG